MSDETLNTTRPAPTLAQRLGHTPMHAETGKPAIDIADPNLYTVARAITENIPAHLIFRRGGKFVTVKQNTRQDGLGLYTVDVKEMTPSRMRTYLCEFLTFTKGTGDKAKATQMPKQIAEAVLTSDPWYDSTEELETVIPVRLPIWGEPKEDGTRTIELAKPGYNPATLTYTAETMNYTTEARQYTPATCRAAWDKLMCTFPWGAEDKNEANLLWKRHDGEIMSGPQPSQNRSACCCLALMLGQYCRLLVDDVMPIGIFNANQRGSGKSLLAWLCVAPVWGMAAGTPDCKNEDDAIKAIQAALISKEPYYMLDDIPVLSSGTINMVATTNEVGGRMLGGLETFRVRNKMQIFATGNNIGTSADVERRSLICDLFMATDAVKRKFKKPLRKKDLATPGWRADLLRLMLSMVRNWADAGCPELVSGSAKPTFETYAEVVGSIMVHNGFLSPFRERSYSGAGGDLIGRTLNRLLAYIVSHIMEKDSVAETFKLSKIVEIAEANDYLQTITGGKNPNNSMGKRLESLRGMRLYDEDGNPFEFGKREGAGQSSYTFTRLKA